MTTHVDLSGRTALVTGAGQNVGRAIALALAEAGARVLVNDVVGERAEAVVAEAEAAGGQAAACPFDVTDWDAVRAAVEDAAPDVLVNNAGNAGVEPISLPPPFVETGPDDWEKFIRVNLYGVLHCTRAALPAMVGRGWGRVVTITSDAARVGSPGLAAYSAAKAGAAAFSRSIAAEVGRHGVTVNCVSLGTMMTERMEERETAGDELPKRILRNYMLPRLGRPSDVAGAVLFLASDLGEWVTAQTYAVNGGYSSTL